MVMRSHSQLEKLWWQHIQWQEPEKFGPTAAIHNLYRGKVIVGDIEKSGKYQSKFAREIFSKLGMKIFYMNADEHDKHAAYISHMPHALSYSLANSVMNQENPEAIIVLLEVV